MKRAWHETKYKSGNEANADSSAVHTLKQPSGKDRLPPLDPPLYEELEPAHRFGYGARLKYGNDYLEWNDDLELQLQEDWKSANPTRKEKWELDRDAIHYGWDFNAEMDKNNSGSRK